MAIYPAYLLCLALMIPVAGLTALIGTMLIVAAGPSDAWSVFSNAMTVFAFFGAGLVEPLRYGWRIVALLAVIALTLSAGALPSLRIPAFYVVALLATLGVAFCLFFASREGTEEMLTTLLVLSPSIAGILACVWCANKFAGQASGSWARSPVNVQKSRWELTLKPMLRGNQGQPPRSPVLNSQSPTATTTSRSTSPQSPPTIPYPTTKEPEVIGRTITWVHQERAF